MVVGGSIVRFRYVVDFQQPRSACTCETRRFRVPYRRFQSWSIASTVVTGWRWRIRAPLWGMSAIAGQPGSVLAAAANFVNEGEITVSRLA